MTFLRTIFLLTIILLTGCSSRTVDHQAIDTDKGAEKIARKENTVAITPQSATAQSVISLNTSLPINDKSEIYWYVNGVRQSSPSGGQNSPARVRFTDNTLKKGDIVQAVIMNDNIKYASNEIVIKNTPPRITNAGIVPTLPKAGSSLSIDADADDVDGDNIDFSYKWTLNGEYAGQKSYLETELHRGDRISVRIIPFDGEERGKGVRLSETVLNSLPVFSETSPSFDGKTYRYRVNATDPDGDTLTFKLEEGPEGMTVDSETGSITWDVKQKDTGTHNIKVSVSDNKGGKIVVPFTTTIEFGV